MHHYDKDHNAMVLDFLGPSLEDMLKICNGRFTLKTVLMLAQQLITRLQYIHQKDYIHSDIKPENILMGVGKRANMVHIVDFGLAKRYREPKSHDHIPYCENMKLGGTARYSSIHTHMGIERSRRDDMESLGYVLIRFLLGSLPWQNLEAETKKEIYDLILEKKKTTSLKDLCRGLPREFITYLEHTRALKFDEKPDYDKLRGIFGELFYRESYKKDYVFDWTALEHQKFADSVARAAERNTWVLSKKFPWPLLTSR